MGTNKMRKVATLVLLVAVAAVAAPASSATGPGTIKITAPTPSTFHSGVVAVEWSWRSGQYVKSSSKVDAYVTNNGVTWKKIASAMPIRDGGFEWSVAALSDAPHALRVIVTGTTVRATASPLFIDNTKPVVEIVRPTTGQIVVDDTTPSFAVVAGKATLVADARDAFSGIAEVRWLLNGTQIGTGRSMEYNFTMVPGQHTLTAVAADNAGNTAEHSITVVALPGPSGIGSIPSPSPIPSAPSLPEAPQAPDAPDAPDLPQPDPSSTPSPPGQPEPPADPTELIPDGLPTP